MSISKENILKLYKSTPIDEKLINKPALDIFDLLLVKESQPPNKEKKEITNEMYYNNIEENWHKSNSNNITEFNRGGNFKPKEEIIDIKIENIYLFNKKFNFPNNNKSFYVKNSNYNNFTGPFSSNEIEEQYKNKKINIFSEFRPIDIFMFKDKQIFSFQNFKILNDENWINNIEDNSLLQYSILFQNNQKNNKEINKENKTDENSDNNISEKNIEKKQNEEKEDNKIAKKDENKINNEKKDEVINNKIDVETKSENKK